MARKEAPQDGQRDDNEESMFRLDQEIARKYDPQTLSRLIMRDAGRGEPLDLHTRSRMEHSLGGDFSGVREAMERSLAEGSQTFEEDLARLIERDLQPANSWRVEVDAAVDRRGPVGEVHVGEPDHALAAADRLREVKPRTSASGRCAID